MVAVVESQSAGIEDLHPDVLMLALRRMDGPTLAAAAVTCSSLRSATSDEDIWQDLCLSTWPSLRHLPFIPSYRSFFADAFSFPSSSAPDTDIIPDKLIYAVDLYHRGAHLLSKVVETDTSSSQFQGSPFRIDVLDSEKDTTQTPLSVSSPEELMLRWVAIDPATWRAVRVSSVRPVSVQQQWYTYGEAEVHFAAVMGDRHHVASAIITCGEKGEVREVVLTVEDANGISVDGRDGLVILKGAMEGRRRTWDENEAHRLYMERAAINKQRKKDKIQRELMLDFCSSAAGLAILMAFLFYIAFK